jgi:hypothetical protein
MKGLVVYDHMHLFNEMTKVLGRWIAAGSFRWREDVTDGLVNAPEAFCRLMRGEQLRQGSRAVAESTHAEACLQRFGVSVSAAPRGALLACRSAPATHSARETRRVRVAPFPRGRARHCVRPGSRG